MLAPAVGTTALLLGRRQLWAIVGVLMSKFFARKSSKFHNLPGASRLVIESLESRQMLAVAAVGDELLVNGLVDGIQSTDGSAAAVGMSDTNHVVVYTGSGAQDADGVFARVFDVQGAALGAAFQVNNTREGNQHSAAVAVHADGTFVVVWAGRGVGDKQGIFFRRYSATGTALSEETLVNTTTGGKQVDPTIAMAADGSFAIAWSGVGTGDASGVFLRRFDAAGAAAADEIRINTTTASDQAMPDIVFDDDGNLIAVWASRNQDGSDWGIYAQRYNSAGVAQGTEFVVNSTTANSQMAPNVAIDPTGGFLVAWQSWSQDGAGWGVVARRFTAAGATDGAEFVLNNTTAGHQKNVSVGFTDDGKLIAAWVTGTTNGHGWEVQGRSYNADGVADGLAFGINEDTKGANSGNQGSPHVALNANDAMIVWSGNGAVDRHGVYAQRFETDATAPTQQAPVIADIADAQAIVGTQIEITVTASDPNSSDTLTFTLDADHSPANATITKTGDNTAIIRWTPASTDQATAVNFRVVVTDDGTPPLSDSEDFLVNVGATSLTVDLNGADETGTGVTAGFVLGGGAVVIAPDLVISQPGTDVISGTTAVLAETPDGSAESLAVDTTGTPITASYSSSTRTLTLTGDATLEQYQQVLRTLRYDNTNTSASGSRTIEIQVLGFAADSNTATATVNIGNLDLVAFANALKADGAKLYGAGWSADTTAQKELFEDGGQFLEFVEVTNGDRTPNAAATQNGITTYPTWIFDDGTRLEGVQSLQALSEHTGIAIPTSLSPFIAPISNTTLLIGSPLHVPLDGYDPNGGPLTYTVTTNNSGVTATVLSGNRSARVKVAGFGDMVFELFEDRASRATERMIELAEDDFYKDIIFHRVIDNFVIQGGDPTGTGSGGSPLDNFDDQFHPDLQHNRTGVLSMAKSSDDTNDSQFFITEGAQRSLDFNHTIFGIMTEGEAVRDAISNMAVNSSDRPTTDIVMEGIDIFEDQENAVVMLKAAEGTTGTVTVTVTAADQNGNTFQRVFTVNVQADTSNGQPYLEDIDPVSVPRNTVASIQLTSVDVEGDPVEYTAQKVTAGDYTLTVNSTGLVQVTPEQDYVGTIDILVGVRDPNATNGNIDTQLISVQFT
jgi:cyclophilin family peptidyl-prolyl cis-trans isomerase